MAEREVFVDPDGTGDYASLELCEAGEQTVGNDLVTDGDYCVWTCQCTGGTADTDDVTISGWTTGETTYIQAWTDPAESYRSNGRWQTGNKYRLEVNTQFWPNAAIRNEEDYVSIIGLQIKIVGDAGSGFYAIYINANATTSYIEIGYNICTCDAGSFASTLQGINLYSGISDVFNCIVYGYNGTSLANGVGIVTRNDTINVYNTVIYGCKSYGNSDSYGEGNFYNCAVFGNGYDFYSPGGRTVDYCASDDGDGTNAVVPSDWDDVFENYAAGDFRLKSTDTDLTGAGTDDPGSGLYSDDIAGTARTSTWDIGAWENTGGGTGGGGWHSEILQPDRTPPVPVPY